MRRLIIISAAGSPVLLIALWTRAPLVGLAIMAASHAALMYATLRPNVQWLGPVVTMFDTTAPEVWLTIDDGPADDTAALLALFATLNVRATFFVKGALVRERPDLVRAMIEAGHSVGNHSDTHPSATFWCLPPAAIARQIDRCNEALRDIAGSPPSWFRAPVGMKNPFVHPQLERRGMRLIGWSARAFDSVRSDAESVASRIVRRVTPGTIILLHQGRPSSVPAIERVVRTLQGRGYAIVVPAEDRLLTARGAR